MMFLVMIGVGAIKAEAKDTPLKVLFIGNSFTYYNNAPNMFKDVAEFRGKNISVNAATNGGQNLIYNSTADNVVKEIKKGGYDVVVLQDKVGSNFQKETLLEGLDKIIPLVKQYSPDARFVLYEPWPTRDKIKAKTSYFVQSYIEGANKHNAVLAPAGEVVYDLYRNYNRDYICYDNRHPQPLATFAAVNCIYYALFPDEQKQVFENSNQSKLDTIINSNVCYTKDGVKDSYPLADLNKINELSYLYTHKVIDAVKGEGTYVSVGYADSLIVETSTTYQNKVEIVMNQKPVIKTAKKKKKKISIKFKKKVKYATGYVVKFYKTKANAKKNKKCLVKYTYKHNKNSFTVTKTKFKKYKKLYIVAQAYVKSGATKYYSKKSQVKICK